MLSAFAEGMQHTASVKCEMTHSHLISFYRSYSRTNWIRLSKPRNVYAWRGWLKLCSYKCSTWSLSFSLEFSTHVIRTWNGGRVCNSECFLKTFISGSLTTTIHWTIIPKVRNLDCLFWWDKPWYLFNFFAWKCRSRRIDQFVSRINRRRPRTASCLT